MSTLRQACPSCNRQLELPTSALGRLAKCPACEAVFTVTVSTDLDLDPGQPQSAAPPPPTRSVPPPPTVGPDSPPISFSNQHETPQGVSEAWPEIRPAGPASPEGATSPVYQDANPFSSPLDQGMAADLSTNPYRPPDYADEPVAEVGNLKIVSRPIEEVFSTTFAIFGDRCGMLILAFLLFLVATFIALIAPVLVLRIIADAGGGAFAGIAFLLLAPLLILFSGYLSVGLARNALAVARNSPAPISELMPPTGIVIRFLVGAGVMTAVVTVVGIIIGGLMSLVSAGGNNGLITLATVIVFFAATVLSIVAYWLLWSWWFIVSDGRGTAWGSMQAAVTLTMHNKATSILLLVVTIVLSIAGTMFCYVGHLITTPLTMLLLAVAYLLMTNQQVSDPRIARQNYQHPSLGQSPY